MAKSTNRKNPYGLSTSASADQKSGAALAGTSGFHNEATGAWTRTGGPVFGNRKLKAFAQGGGFITPVGAINTVPIVKFHVPEQLRSKFKRSTAYKKRLNFLSDAKQSADSRDKTKTTIKVAEDTYTLGLPSIKGAKLKNV